MVELLYKSLGLKSGATLDEIKKVYWQKYPSVQFKFDLIILYIITGLPFSCKVSKQSME
jgi:hypothetical protein